MVIKGSSRGQSAVDVRRLAEHLLAAENEEVCVLEITGVTAADLPGALAEMRAVSLGSRARKALYHASVNVARDEAGKMTPARWRESVDVLERRLGLFGHPRAVVRHRKRQRDHIHVVWSRIDPATMRCVSDAHNYRTHEQVSRVLEDRFGLHPVVGAHSRPSGMPRPVARASHRCWQAAERTGVPVSDVAALIRGAWDEAADGKVFAAALHLRGLSLAKGRRGLVVLDRAGTPHSIPRRLGMRAAEVRLKLADLDEDAFPAVDDAKREAGKRRRKPIVKEKAMGATPARTADTAPPDWEAIEAYWRGLGYTPVREWNAVVIDVGGSLVRDRGGRIELSSAAEPTDEQVAMLVAACIARGWDGIRFYGSEEFQHRAREEAIRQGFPADRITLECERNVPAARPAPSPLPEHLSRRLGKHRNTGNAMNGRHPDDAEQAPPPAP